MEGASVAEQLIGAARSNNESLIESLIAGKSKAEVAKLLNTTVDPVGNGLLHLAAGNGALEVVDLILDQEGVEIEHLNRLQHNTPLFCAVEYAVKDPAGGIPIVELLIEAGANPSPKNKAGKRPKDVAKDIPELMDVLMGAQLATELQREAAGFDGDAAGAADVEPEFEGPPSDDE